MNAVYNTKYFHFRDVQEIYHLYMLIWPTVYDEIKLDYITCTKILVL